MRADPASQDADASPSIRLRVLIVEDSPDDALLLSLELERGGYEPYSERVHTPEAMRQALEEGGPWDVVLSDWRMPRFSATEALAMLRGADPDTPFVIVSGQVGEEAAVEAMRAGAHDYVMKGDLARLGATVERGLREAEARRERRRAEEERDRLFELSLDLLGVAGMDGYFKRVNPAFGDTLGYPCGELLEKPFIEFVHPEDRAATMEELDSLSRGVRTAYFENRYLRSDGSEVWLEWKVVPVLEEDLLYATARDVTERKRAEATLNRRDAILRAVAFAAERFLKQAAPWKESAQEVLERLGVAAEVSRVYIFENLTGADGAPLPTKRHEWLAPGVPAGAETPTTIGLPHRAIDPRRWEEILARGDLLCGHRREFPQAEQAMLEAEGVLSIALVPVFVEGEWWGFIGFDECFVERGWSPAETEVLEAAANTLGAAIERERAEEALNRRDAILRAVAFAAERFLEKVAPWEDSVPEVLRRLGVAGETSRVYILENHVGDDGALRFALRHEWVAPGVTAQIDDPSQQSFPYEASGYGRWARSMGRGESIYGHARDFPEGERHELERQDVLSITIVPVFVEGEWWGQIGFDECFTEREWSPAEVDALKAAADTLGAAIQRERAEEATRQSEQLYRTVVEQATEYISLVDVETRRFVGSNPAFREALGYSEDELSEMTLYDVVAHDRDSIDENAGRVVDRGRHYLGERQHRRKDGSLLDVEVSASTILHGGRRVACVVGHDVTERKRAEEEVRESEGRYRAVVEQAAEGIFLFDAATGRILESNAAFQELLGHTAAELAGMTLYDVVAHDRESIESNVRLVVDEGRRFVGERVYRRKDGSLAEVEVAANLISYGGREVICTVIRDVTERLEAFRLLEERVTALARISASLTVGQTMEVTLDVLSAGIVQSTAAVACSVLLIDPETGLPRMVGSHGLPDGYTAGLEEIYRSGASSPAVEAFHTRRPILVRDARQRGLDNPLYAPIHRFLRDASWDAFYSVPLVSRGEALGSINLSYLTGHEPEEDEAVFLGAIADQTAVAVENARLFANTRGKAALEERQRLARELHDSVSQALYGIALGSRTAHALLHREGSAERVGEWLEYVLSLAEAGLTEMRALIFELRPESLETEGLIVALKQQADALKARHEIPVHATLGEEPDLSLETKEALYRIAQEALHNTVKHARATRADLKLECDATGIALEVSDDGAGFDPEGDFSGHLGLKSMRERAARLGGEIQVQSAPGEGTSIRVRVPPRPR